MQNDLLQTKQAPRLDLIQQISQIKMNAAGDLVCFNLDYAPKFRTGLTRVKNV